MENYYLEFGEMSKIGYKEIPLPGSVQLNVDDGIAVIKGSKGELRVHIPENISFDNENGLIKVQRANEKKDVRALHGLFRSLLANAINGVENLWEKKLKIVGTGYNVKMEGEDLVFKIGYSHPVKFKKVPGVIFKTEGNNLIIVSGIDKQLVGQIAYQIKCIRKPDAYKGKGIRYEDEVVRLKPGKKAKA